MRALDADQRPTRRRPRSRASDAPRRRALLDGARDAWRAARQVEGLGEVVERAVAHRADGALAVAVRGGDDHRHVGCVAAQLARGSSRPSPSFRRMSSSTQSTSAAASARRASPMPSAGAAPRSRRRRWRATRPSRMARSSSTMRMVRARWSSRPGFYAAGSVTRKRVRVAVARVDERAAVRLDEGAREPEPEAGALPAWW